MNRASKTSHEVTSVIINHIVTYDSSSSAVAAMIKILIQLELNLTKVSALYVLHELLYKRQIFYSDIGIGQAFSAKK